LSFFLHTRNRKNKRLISDRKNLSTRNFVELLSQFAVIRHEGVEDGVRKTGAYEELSDSELLQLSSKGNEGAFLTLFRRHEGPVFRFALHMSGRRETAEEVTQEVFLTLLSDGKLYAEEQGTVQGYLIGVARNKVRRHLADARVFDSAELEEPSSSGTDLLNDLSKGQEIEGLRTAILSLPPNYREVVVLCDLEDLTYAQAAQQLNCAIGTVRSRLHRARAILSMKLRKCERCRV
jgi:RNA polymerase sigma-70 factor, ECF subfamily